MAVSAVCTAAVSVNGFLGRRFWHLHISLIPYGGLYTGILRHISSYRRLGPLHQADFLLRSRLLCPGLYPDGSPYGHGLSLGRELNEHALDGRRSVHGMQPGLESQQQKSGMDGGGEQNTCICGLALHLFFLFRCGGQNHFELVAFCDVHQIDYFLDGYGAVGVYRESGVIGVPQQELEGRLDVGERHGLRISVDVVGACSLLRIMLYGHTDGGLGRDLVGTLGQQ